MLPGDNVRENLREPQKPYQRTRRIRIKGDQTKSSPERCTGLTDVSWCCSEGEKREFFKSIVLVILSYFSREL